MTDDDDDRDRDNVLRLVGGWRVVVCLYQRICLTSGKKNSHMHFPICLHKKI